MMSSPQPPSPTSSTEDALSVAWYSRDQTVAFSMRPRWLMAGETTVRPFLLKTQGMSEVMPRSIAARADFDWLEPDARREFLRVKWNAQGGLDLYPTQDSAVLTSTSWADGLVDNPAQQVIRRGDAVRLLPYSELYR